MPFSCVNHAIQNTCSTAVVPNLGYAYPGGSPEVFQGVRRWLAEANVTYNVAIMLSLYVVHKGELVFL